METKNSIQQYPRCKISKNSIRLQRESPRTANTQRIWDQAATEKTVG